MAFRNELAKVANYIHPGVIIFEQRDIVYLYL